MATFEIEGFAQQMGVRLGVEIFKRARGASEIDAFTVAACDHRLADSEEPRQANARRVAVAPRQVAGDGRPEPERAHQKPVEVDNAAWRQHITADKRPCFARREGLHPVIDLDVDSALANDLDDALWRTVWKTAHVSLFPLHTSD